MPEKKAVTASKPSARPRASKAQAQQASEAVRHKPAAASKSAAEPKLSFRDRQFALREEAIIDAVNRQLSSRGYEAMVLDDVAAEVGIAKGSLYKHFESKEVLAAAAMTRLLERLLAKAQSLPTSDTPLDQLKELLRWTLRERALGQMPTLPSTNTTLQQALMNDKNYMNALSHLTDAMGALIEKAVKAKQLSGSLPLPVMMFSIYARSCDPSFDFLRATQQWSDDRVIEYMVDVCFEGLAPRKK
jgi:TetR/AcrR family transcriptional regulator, regulator of autoinduction and epiphytic fitness